MESKNLKKCLNYLIIAFELMIVIIDLNKILEDKE